MLTKRKNRRKRWPRKTLKKMNNSRLNFHHRSKKRSQGNKKLMRLKTRKEGIPRSKKDPRKIEIGRMMKNLEGIHLRIGNGTAEETAQAILLALGTTSLKNSLEHQGVDRESRMLQAMPKTTTSFNETKMPIKKNNLTLPRGGQDQLNNRGKTTLNLQIPIDS